MKYDNLQLVDRDNDGDLDVLTSEEGEGIFTVGSGALWFENPLNSPLGGGVSSQNPSARKQPPHHQRTKYIHYKSNSYIPPPSMPENRLQQLSLPQPRAIRFKLPVQLE
jgi:hypothetical protein